MLLFHYHINVEYLQQNKSRSIKSAITIDREIRSANTDAIISIEIYSQEI